MHLENLLWKVYENVLVETPASETLLYSSQVKMLCSNERDELPNTNRQTKFTIDANKSSFEHAGGPLEVLLW